MSSIARLNIENNIETSIDADISGSDNTISVLDASGMPSAPFRMTLENDSQTQREIVEVGSVDSVNNDLNSVSRGLEGTSAQSWSSGTKIELRFTRGVYDELLGQDGNDNFDVDSGRIVNLTDPTGAQDAATKNYVDSEVTDSQVDAQDDGTSVLADAEAFNFKGGHFDVSDDGSSVAGIDISTGSIENSLLVNSNLTIAGNLVSLGGSTSVATTDLSDQNITTPSAGQTILYDATAGEFVNASITAGTALGSTSADGSFTLNVQEGNINHDNLSGFVANEHVDHSTVNISAGNALTGGGDLTASRTIDVATGGIGTNEVDESANFSFSNLGATTINSTLSFTSLSANEVISVDIDSGGTGNDRFAQFEFLDASGDNIGWYRDGIAGNDFAIKIRNNTAGNDLFTVKETGDVSIPNGNLDMSNNNVDNVGFLNIDNSGNSELIWSESGTQKYNLRYNTLSDGFELGEEGVGSVFFVNDGGEMDLARNLDMQNNSIVGVRSSGTALAAGDLSNGEIAMDEANGRLVWKDGSGSAYYVSGTAL